MQDFGFALRTLRKQPGFTVAAVATLVLGIGASTAVFSLLYQILVRPLSYAEADRLVWVWNTYGAAGEERTAVSIPDYLDRKNGAAALEDATLFTRRAVALTGGAQPEELQALAVTPSFFSTLGRAPLVGRAFTDDEARAGQDHYAILTHALWRTHFSADPGVVGRDVQLNGEPWRVLGVMPEDFLVPIGEAALLVPFGFTAAQQSDQARGSEFSFMIARLRVGATIAQSDQQFARIVEETMVKVAARAAYMRTSHFGGRAVPLRDRLVGSLRTPLYVLQGAVIVVLLIACANVANLLLMRANRRSRELAVRSALGAGRWRIARQLIAEGLVLSATGAAGGVAAGLAGVRVLVALNAQRLPVAVDATLQWPVLVCAVALALGTGVLFGLAPALNVLRGIDAGLRDDSARATGGRRSHATRTMLVVTETALALMLLVGAGLLIKSFARVLSVDPGFSTTRVLTAAVSVPAIRYPTQPAMTTFWFSLAANASAIPGVQAAGLTSSVPFSGTVSAGTYQLTGRPPAPTEKLPHAQFETVHGDYFRALQIPLVEGRLFNDGDAANRQRVVVVDQFLARRQFPGRSAIGEFLNFGSPRNYEIIGVVGTINAADLATPVPEERIYFTAGQLPPSAMGIVLKTSVEPSTIVPLLRAAVQRIDPRQPIANVRTMDEWLGRSLQPRRTPTALLAVFGAVALTLAAIGIYGVLAFAVSERAREFGIRQALGADRCAILGMVLSQGLRTAGIGIAIGLAGCIAVTRVLQSMLFGVERSDMTVLGGVSLLLFAVAMCACYLPARWATRVDPMVALRDN